MNPNNYALPGETDVGYTSNINSCGYAIRQQTMKAWQPVPTINSTLLIFFLISAFFLVLGFVQLALSLSVVEHSIEYTNCSPHFCNLTITPSDTMKQPVFLYYELTNYYQNHFLYVKSRDQGQLAGDEKGSVSGGSCDPITTMDDVGRRVTYKNIAIPGNAVANPCGLTAKSMFNDAYELWDGNRNVTINDKGIAWPSDLEYRYKRDDDAAKTQWIDVEDEHFIVWMRAAALPKFRKLWGKIEEDLVAGQTYTIVVRNNYDVTPWDGTKSVVLSTSSAFGGKNLYLMIGYLIVGGITFVLFLIFLVRKFVSVDKFKELDAKIK